MLSIVLHNLLIENHFILPLNAFKDDFQLKMFDEFGLIKVENFSSITKLITP